jgi:glycosyltransferase involved in cell wall biosynthesis
LRGAAHSPQGTAVRILHTIHSVNPATGGTAEALRQLAAAHREMGHTVEIASLDAADEPWIASAPVPVQALGPGRGSYGYSPRFVPWVREHAGKFDVVVAHGFWQHHNVGVARALAGLRTPYFLFAHGMLDDWFRRTYPLKHLKKCVYWWLWQHRAMERAAAVLFTSEEEWRSSRRSFTPFRCRKAIVPLGITPPPGDAARLREAFLDSMPALRGRSVLLFLGRIHEKKGCDLLAEAVRTLRDQPEWASGDGGPRPCVAMLGPCADERYRARLEARAKEGASEADIVWGGMVSGDLKWGAFYAADAFVLPSHQENFGVAVVEALACGVPVLISDRVNIWREVVCDGAGFGDTDDVAGTTRLLRRWLTTSAAEREAMRQRARASFAARFEIRRAAQRLIEVLQTRAI